MEKLLRGMRLINSKEGRGELNSLKYIVLDLRDDDSWRPLIRVEKGNR